MLFAAPLGVSSPGQNVLRLQYALRNLSAFTADPTLQVSPDGRYGPHTHAAANRALALYAQNAAPPFRTGRLSPRQVLRNAGTITSTLEELAPL